RRRSRRLPSALRRGGRARLHGVRDDGPPPGGLTRSYMILGMTKHLHIVLSAPPEHVTDDEYNAWYDAHVEEILSVPGWLAATRYRVEGVVDPEHTGVYRYMSVYEL